MKPSIGVVALSLGLVTTCCGQDSQKKSLPPECTKTIPVKDSSPTVPYKILPNESYKRSPRVKFLIQENGTVSDVEVTRSSGVTDIDKKVADSVSRWKFRPRPIGCGIIESDATVLIHWGRDSH
jgi:TonB family protein